jgi:acetyltransferase-like isoleucine patch superfamily enzyme
MSYSLSRAYFSPKEHGFLALGEHPKVDPRAEIEGRYVRIGDDFFMDAYAWIGGGSCMDAHSSLICGNYLHMGRFSHINTARAVIIGDEVGIGIGTRIFTHGAWLPAPAGYPYKFAPVAIGSRVWLPNAIVSPGVEIGSDVVVLPGSVVTKDLPDGCLAGGTPAKVISENAFPKILTEDERDSIIAEIVADANEIYMVRPVGDANDVLLNQLRRYGVRT